MKKITIFLSILLFFSVNIVNAEDLMSRLKGKIIIKVEDYGKAYYINPNTDSVNYLGKPEDAFSVMREQGVGVTNQDLYKISVGVNNSGTDTDGDGLADNLEDAIGLDMNSRDTDGDGYDDKNELEAGYSPWGDGKQNIDSGFTDKQKGKILLQIEKNGEAWYVNPNDGKRYFLGRPADAFSVMRNLGLGISNSDFDNIYNTEESVDEINSPVINNSIGIYNFVSESEKDGYNVVAYDIENKLEVQASALDINYLPEDKTLKNALESIVIDTINTQRDDNGNNVYVRKYYIYDVVRSLDYLWRSDNTIYRLTLKNTNKEWYDNYQSIYPEQPNGDVLFLKNSDNVFENELYKEYIKQYPSDLVVDDRSLLDSDLVFVEEIDKLVDDGVIISDIGDFKFNSIDKNSDGYYIVYYNSEGVSELSLAIDLIDIDAFNENLVSGKEEIKYNGNSLLLNEHDDFSEIVWRSDGVNYVIYMKISDRNIENSKEKAIVDAYLTKYPSDL